MARRRLHVQDYTVGWICALPVELGAATRMLDEEHQNLPREDANTNLYTFGHIGPHNVVIACLPAGLTGTNSAAAVAAEMKSTFMSIRFSLLVGIGGGVPRAGSDIRLGDVVISQPCAQDGGVVQYDSGRAEPHGFTRTGSLNKPPVILLNALAKLQAKRDMGGNGISTHLSAFANSPKSLYDEARQDLLFKPDYQHVQGLTCNRCSIDQLLERNQRDSQELVLHYGTIASGNQVIKDGLTRDWLSSQLGGVLCFEMEAAGLMNIFPCLVIRGICDYADSHKNKTWQPCAAAMAAACAKELLMLTTPAQFSPYDSSRQAITDRGERRVTSQHFPAQDVGRHYVVSQQRRKIHRMVGLITIIILLAVVVAVAVVRSRHKSPAPVSSNSPSNSSTPSPSAVPVPQNIAAVSFASNAVNYTRLYFQDDMGQIIESEYAADNPTWIAKATGVFGKNGSAIAAAVSRPDFPLEISVFYLDVNNLIHDVVYNDTTSTWTSGILSSQGYAAMSNSSLSAMYNQCKLCANTTVIAFQDENGFVQIGNFTSSGWSLTQLDQSLNPIMGTGLALQPFYRAGMEDQINLYHQKSGLNMGLASWKPALANSNVAGWSLNEQIYDPIPFCSPIAAASSYSNATTGYESWIEVLSLSDTGIEVNTWSGAINDWLVQYSHPSVMANSTDNEKIYGNVAITATGNAFAVVSKDGPADGIENWQVADDTVEWTLVGSVDLHRV